MTYSSKYGIVGVISILVQFHLVQACSSDSTPASTATLGASAAGAAAASGGTSATDGTSALGGSSATGGSPSATGGAIGRDCTASNTLLAPTDGIVANFSDADGGIGFVGRLLEFPFDGTAPTVSMAGGALHITQNAPVTTLAQYTGVAIGFGLCVDVTAFTGVQFKISGSVSGACTLQYMTGDSVHQDAASGAPFATGSTGTYQPRTPILTSQISSTPTTLQMPFDGTVSHGNPSSPLNLAKIILLAWEFDIEATTNGADCVADITIDDVKFY